MATLSYSNQLKFTGAGYIDGLMMPVKTYADLGKIPTGSRFKGLEVVVLNDENTDEQMAKYWLKDGIQNNNWVKKEYSSGGVTTVDGDDQEN